MEALDRRLSRLETLVGDKALGTHKTKEGGNLANSLLNLAKESSSAVHKRSRISNLWVKTADLSRLLDPSLGSEDPAGASLVSLDVKRSIVEAEEANLTQLAEDMTKVSEKQHLLNAEAFSKVSELTPRLNNLQKALLDMDDEVKTLNEEVKEILINYNSLVEAFNEAFLHLHQKVSELEEAKARKK